MTIGRILDFDPIPSVGIVLISIVRPFFHSSKPPFPELWLGRLRKKARPGTGASLTSDCATGQFTRKVSRHHVSKSTVSDEPLIFPLNHAITFTTRLFEPSPIQYLDFLRSVSDETGTSENASCNGDAGRACAKHIRQKLLR